MFGDRELYKKNPHKLVFQEMFYFKHNWFWYVANFWNIINMGYKEQLPID